MTLDNSFQSRPHFYFYLILCMTTDGRKWDMMLLCKTINIIFHKDIWIFALCFKASLIRFHYFSTFDSPGVFLPAMSFRPSWEIPRFSQADVFLVCPGLSFQMEHPYRIQEAFWSLVQLWAQCWHLSSWSCAFWRALWRNAISVRQILDARWAL